MTTDNNEDSSNQEPTPEQPMPSTLQEAVAAHNREAATQILRGQQYLSNESLAFFADDTHYENLKQTFPDDAQNLHEYAQRVMLLPDAGPGLREKPLDNLRSIYDANEIASRSRLFRGQLDDTLQRRVGPDAYQLAVHARVHEKVASLKELPAAEQVNVETLVRNYTDVNELLQRTVSAEWTRAVSAEIPENVKSASEVYGKLEDMVERIQGNRLPRNGHSVQELNEEVSTTYNEMPEDNVKAALATYINERRVYALDRLVAIDAEQVTNPSYMANVYEVARSLNDSLTEKRDLSAIVLGADSSIHAAQAEVLHDHGQDISRIKKYGTIAVGIVGVVSIAALAVAGVCSGKPGPRGPQGSPGVAPTADLSGVYATIERLQGNDENLQADVGRLDDLVATYHPPGTATPLPVSPTPVYNLPDGIRSAPYVAFTAEAAEELARELGITVDIARNDTYGASYNPGRLHFYTPEGVFEVDVPRTQLDDVLRDIGRENPDLVERGIEGYGKIR